MGAFTIPAGSGTVDFNNITVSGAAFWTADNDLTIESTGTLSAYSTTSAYFGTTNYGFTVTESTGSITIAGRIQKNIVSATDDATAAIDCAVTDIYELTAMANATTFSVTGTPLNGQTLIVRLKDNGTARALTWGSEFASKGATLPTTTVLGKQHYVGFVYNSASSKWECIMATVEA